MDTASRHRRTVGDRSTERQAGLAGKFFTFRKCKKPLAPVQKSSGKHRDNHSGTAGGFSTGRDGTPWEPVRLGLGFKGFAKVAVGAVRATSTRQAEFLRGPHYRRAPGSACAVAGSVGPQHDVGAKGS
jgi:hypothetical protein